jgi:anti-sigma regulatory factor (Ser/Thr protein kinase)
MTGNGKHTTGEILNLKSRVSELAQIPPWIERLASRFSIPESTQFAMNLCLEEALSNVIWHGYSGKPDHSIAVHFASPGKDYFVFVVEDQAPPFNPVDSPELPSLNERENNDTGGQGIRLLRQFADSLEYQATPTGNRLSIGFSSIRSAIAKD